MLPVGRSELEKVYKKHYDAYSKLKSSNSDMRSRQLLLVYAVECGLKYLWLSKNRKDKIDSSMINKVGLKTHNINWLQAKCMLPNIKDHMVPCIPMPDSKSSASPKEFHELCRYGIKVKDETDIVNMEQILCSIYSEMDSCCNKIKR